MASASFTQMNRPSVQKWMTVWQALIPAAYILFVVKFSERMTAGMWLVLGAGLIGWAIVTVRARQEWSMLRVMPYNATTDIATRSIWHLMSTVNVFALLLLLALGVLH